MFVILSLMSTAVLSGIAIKNSVKQMSENIESNTLNGIALQTDFTKTFSSNRGFGSVTNKEINALLSLNQAKRYVKRMVAVASLVGSKTVDVTAEDIEYGAFDDRNDSQSTDIVGVNDSELENKFVAGTLKLTQGRHIKENDVNTMLVHEDFAKLNNLKVGDTITLETNLKEPDNYNKKVVTQTVTIVGLFSGKSQRRPTSRFELYQNIMIADVTTTRNLNSYTEKDEIYHDATFFLKNGKATKKFVADAKKLPLDWQKYNLSRTSDDYIALNNSVNAMYEIMNKLLIGSIITTVLLLSVILFMWLKERKKETAILMSIGVSKMSQVLQYITELIMIFVLSLTTGVLISKMITNQVGNSLLASVQNSKIRDVSRQVNLAGDAESSVLTKTIDNISVAIGHMDIVSVALIGLAIIVICVLIVSIPMLKTKPKELLEELE